MERNPDVEGTPDVGPDIYPPETFSAFGNVKGPTAAKEICKLLLPETGTYQIQVYVGYQTKSSSVINNMGLYIGPVKVATLPSVAEQQENGIYSGPFDYKFIIEQLPRDTIYIKTIAKEPETEVVYRAHMLVTKRP